MAKPAEIRNHPGITRNVHQLIAESPPELIVGERLIRTKELVGRVGRTYAHIIILMEKNEFPRPRDFSNGPAWLDSEITAWMHSLPPRPVRGDPEAEGMFSQQKQAAVRSVESKRRAAAEARRANVRKRSRKRARAA